MFILGIFCCSSKNTVYMIQMVRERYLNVFRVNPIDTKPEKRGRKRIYNNNIICVTLQIKFTDPKFARYLESTVAGRDLVAFTFESTRDMNLFRQKVREQGLNRVNAICSQGGPVERPSTDIQQLRLVVGR